MRSSRGAIITIAIIGSPGFNDVELFNNTLNRLTNQYINYNIITGDSTDGAEKLARSYNKKVKSIEIISPEDYLHKGELKSKLLLRKADLLFAVWDGIDRYTFDIIRSAYVKNIPVKILSYD